MIIRAEKNRNYTVINNTILNDARLSWKARGLAAYLLTKPDNWHINRDHLATQGPDGIAAVRSALQELRDFGYITSEPGHTEDGRFCWDTVLHEVPQPPRKEIVLAEKPPAQNQPPQPPKQVVLAENMPAEKPPARKPPARNRTLVSTETVSTQTPSTEKQTAAAAATALPPTRANEFAIYETEIGVLTPAIADQLKADLDEYPAGWLADAIREAALANVRKYSYVRAILRRWHNEGRNRRTNNAERAGNGYHPQPDDDPTFGGFVVPIIPHEVNP